MGVIEESKLSTEYTITAAKAAAAAALSAPTIAGTRPRVEILTDKEVVPLIEILEVVGEANTFVAGDAAVGRKAHEAGIPIVELLVGVDGTTSELAWNCGACGFNTCAEFNSYSKQKKSQGAFYVGPNCNWKMVDFGIACSSAAAAVSAMNVDCRAQASYGFAGMAVGYLAGCSVVTAVSIGPLKESPWYDRVDLKDSFPIEEHGQFMKNTLPQLFVAFPGGGYPLLKHRPDWAAEPKFWKEMEDKEFLAKQQDILARVGKIIERERSKRA